MAPNPLKRSRPRQGPSLAFHTIGVQGYFSSAQPPLSEIPGSAPVTPIVPVAKSNGTVRICGDYKTTVNPQLQTEEYSLPRIDDIFAKLAGGQKFTKIDLRQAYHQMEVEEES